VIHQFDPAMAPDTDYVPGALAYLAPGNSGRMLDRRRTPVRVLEVRPGTGQWVCEVLAFEDQGARWVLPLESVTSYQFDRGAARASESAVRKLRAAVRKFNVPAQVPPNSRNRKPTERAIAKRRREVATWLGSKSEFIAAGGTADPGSRRGSPVLARDLEAFMTSCGLDDLERDFAATMVSHPGIGEMAKAHALALADLGLAGYTGTIVRDPMCLEPPWTMARRQEHIETFATLGLGAPVLYRAVSTEGRLEPRAPRTFLSATFSFEVAMSLFGPAWEGRNARLERQIVPVERLFMTYLETAAMNRQFHEAEAVLIEDPENPVF